MNQDTKSVVFLQGPNVVLRPIMRDDIPDLLHWINDPKVNRYISSVMPIMEVDEEEWFEKLPKRKPKDIVLGIVVEGKLIGNMGLHDIDSIARTATTGALIGESQYWGRGFGTEAKMILLNYAFNTLNLRKICSSVIAFNERSRRYSEKCGYTLEGIRKQQFYKEGQYWDEIMLSVFKDSWTPLWSEFLKQNGMIQQ